MKANGHNFLFGNPTDFAIEAGLEPGLVPPSEVWGHVRILCDSVSIGNIENLHCALSDAAMGFAEKLEQLDALWDEELNGLDHRGIWNFLDGKLYGYHGDLEIEDQRTLEQVQADAARYGKFNFLTNWGEPFDGCKAFIMIPPVHRQVRILYDVTKPSFELRSAEVSREEFVEAARTFIAWFDEQRGRLSAGR